METNRHLYQLAVEHVIKDNKPEVSHLQQRLGIGYDDALAFMELLERCGIVSALDSSGNRKVIVKKSIKLLVGYLNKKVKTNTFQWLGGDKDFLYKPWAKGKLEILSKELKSDSNLNAMAYVSIYIDGHNVSHIEIEFEAKPATKDYNLSEFISSWNKLFKGWEKRMNGRLDENFIKTMEQDKQIVTVKKHLTEPRSDKDNERMLNDLGLISHCWICFYMRPDTKKEQISDILDRIYNKMK